MKNIFSAQIPSKITTVILLGFIVLIGCYASYRIGEIIGVSRCQSPPQTTEHRPMRVPLFVAPENVKYETRFHFTFDRAEDLATYRTRERLDDIVQGAANDFEKVRRLLQWTRQQWPPGRPDPYPPLEALVILQEIRAGRTGGFCAQYNYVFVQAVQSFGIKARYVTIQDHEVTEVWIKDFHKWVCFDPLYAAYYTNQQQLPLAVYEIYAAVKQGTPISMKGPYTDTIADMPSHLKRFQRVAMWLKNNHIAAPINFTDIDYYKLYFLESGVDPGQISLKSLATSAWEDFYRLPDQE